MYVSDCTSQIMGLGILRSWAVRETRVSPAHEGDWSNSHVEWSSPISPQLKCSEHVLRFNIKCVCVWHNNTCWEEQMACNCTRHYSLWYGFSSNSYTHIWCQPTRSRDTSMTPVSPYYEHQSSPLYKLQVLLHRFQSHVQKFNGQHYWWDFPSSYWTFFPPEVIPVNFSAIIIKLTFVL